jgi:hypothetical protein
MDTLERDELEAWEPELPPERFAEDVVSLHAATRLRARRTARARLVGAAAGIALVAAVIAVFVRGTGAPDHGDRLALARQEVRLGSRGVAVLEAGAHVAWHGDLVDQSAGEVFYRVERGKTFRVHTAAGDVTVKGTCFDVAVRNGSLEEDTMRRRDVTAGGIGMAVGAMVFVGVYEGKVALSHGATSVDLRAGQGARADSRGVFGPESMGAARAAFDGVPASSEDALTAANANLADSIRDYKKRLEALEAEKKATLARLKAAEAKADGGGMLERSSLQRYFDVSQDDWKKLAEKGEIRYLLPGGPPGPKELAGFGLSPQEEKVLIAAHTNSAARTWGMIEPLCDRVVGESMAQKLGVSGCILIVMHANGDTALGNAMREVGQIRGGLMPMPPNVTEPAEQMLLQLTGETKVFENELAESLGPEQAATLTYQEDTAMLGQTWLPDD